MESSDDGGYCSAVTSAGIFMFAIEILFSCHKPLAPMHKIEKDTTVTVVKVSPPTPEKKIIKKKRKKLYLTFDDGPNKGTSNVL